MVNHFTLSCSIIFVFVSFFIVMVSFISCSIVMISFIEYSIVIVSFVTCSVVNFLLVKHHKYLVIVIFYGSFVLISYVVIDNFRLLLSL